MTDSRKGENWRGLLGSVVDHATDHIDQLEDGPVAATATTDELRTRLSHPLTEEGIDPEQVIEDLVADSKAKGDGAFSVLLRQDLGVKTYA